MEHVQYDKLYDLDAATTSIMSGHKDTEEQQLVIESPAHSLLVRAFSGTGKTNTLVRRVQARPRKRFLYVAFNKANQIDGMRRFPGNAKCMTSHGLAFPKFGSVYADAGKLVSAVRVNNVIDALTLDEYPSEFKFVFADLCTKTLTRFICSANDEIDETLVRGLIAVGLPISAADVVEHTKKLWSMMCDPGDPSVGIPHDGYLKLYQLSRPRLAYDSILFDEGQDANAVTIDIIDKQKNCSKVVVGDSHQAIYGFRLAEDALERFSAEARLYLTQSFRFGQGIADVANMLLSQFKGETQRLRGISSNPGRIGPVPSTQKHTVIARTNSMLFDEAVQGLAARKTLYFVGGVEGYRFGDIMDVYNMSCDKIASVRSDYLRAFGAFRKLKDFAMLTEDKELKSLIRVVDKYESRIPRLIGDIRNCCTVTEQAAGLTLATAHKSKGMEWPTVRLSDDYTGLFDEHQAPLTPKTADAEEVNILYVASTRAMSVLQPTPDMKKMLDYQTMEKKVTRMPEWARPLRAMGGRPKR